MSSMRSYKASPRLPRRNRSDLIDLSHDLDEKKSSNNILEIFDPLNNANATRAHQGDQCERSRVINRSVQPIELKLQGRRFRASSACPSLNLKEQVSKQNLSEDIKIFVTSDGAIVSKPKLAKHNSPGRSGSLSNEIETANDIQRLSLRSNSSNELHCPGSNINGDNFTRMTHRNCSQDKYGLSKQQLETNSNKLKLIRKQQRSSQELLLLTTKFKSFRAKFKHHDKQTNSGLVLSPTLYSSKIRDMSVKIVITSPLATAPMSVTCNMSTTIEHLISHAVCTLFETLAEDDSMDNYLLKVTGKDEFFEPCLCLADYALVSHCWKFDLDVQLTLIHAKSAKRRFQRTSKDDFQCKELLCPDDLLSRTTMLNYSDLNFEALNITIETFEKLALRLYSDVTSRSTSIQTQSLLQVTKQICSLMMNCETGPLSESCNNLAELCRSYKDEGGNSIDEDRYKMIEVIQHAIKRLLIDMKRLLVLMSGSLPVDYELLDECQGLKLSAKQFVDTPINLVKDKVSFKVHLVAQLRPEWLTKYREYHIKVGLMYGDTYITPLVTTSSVRPDFGFFPRLLFDEELSLPAQYSHLPREARFVLTLVGTPNEPAISNQLAVPTGNEGSSIRRSSSLTSISSNAPIFSTSAKSSSIFLADSAIKDLARSVIYVFDHELNLRQGSVLVSMHPFLADSNENIYMETLGSRDDPKLVLELKQFPPEKKIYFPQNSRARHSSKHDGSSIEKLEYDKLDPGVKFVLGTIIEETQAHDALMDDQKILLWESRQYLTSKPSFLPKLLMSVPNWSTTHLGHVYDLVDAWSPMDAVDSMQLLLPSFPDCYIRKKAVDWISKLTDDEICSFLPQLVQAFRYEKNLDCPLFWLLMARVMKNTRMANLMNWQLKLNTRDKLFQERSETLRNCLLWACGGAFWQSIDRQEELLSKLSAVYTAVKKVRDGKKLKTLRKKLEIVQDYLNEKKPTMPWAPSLEICDLAVQSCSYFPSNTLPLKLSFRSCEESCNRQVKFHTYDTIFKMGDDLRQDMLAIQMIRIMEKLWLREGLDLKMVTFDCIATDERQGLVEMVQNAETLRKIQQRSSKITGAFDTRAIDEYLRLHNPSEPGYRTALDRFLHSCAGYSVATYILGICDRHNDNIMITTSGHLFHIDFGKFLGDAQMLGVIKRDRTPFVLTSDMVFAINGGEKHSERFQTFVRLCTLGFSILRRHRNLFSNLFSLMSAAKIHGLSSDSVKYVDKMLMTNLSEKEAITKFTEIIHGCSNSRSAQVNFFIHNLGQIRLSDIT